jgi:ABC-type antimicrobial peptide transport system permease subunit
MGPTSRDADRPVGIMRPVLGPQEHTSSKPHEQTRSATLAVIDSALASKSGSNRGCGRMINAPGFGFFDRRSARVTRAFASQGVSLHLPVEQLAIFAVVAVIAGVLAALLPARRAARVNVLEALQYE